MNLAFHGSAVMTKLKIIIITCIFIFILISSVSFIESGQAKKVHNTLEEIKACENKVKLNLVRVWGDEQSSDEKYILYSPKDIDIRNDGLLIYICDSGNNRIQVYDYLGKFYASIGQSGQGPGDFSSPRSIALDKYNKIIVADSGNYRIQILDRKGKYLSSFDIKEGNVSRIAITKRNEIAMYNPKETFISSNLIHLYDNNGNLIRGIGKHKDFKSRDASYSLSIQTVNFALDNTDNYFISYVNEPYIAKYSHDNKLLHVITFDMPFKIKKYHFVQQDYNMKIIGDQVSAGIAVDESDRIYLVVTTRPRKKSEITTMTASGKGATRRIGTRRGLTAKVSDLFKLLIFDSNGKIIAAKKLNIYCNNIHVRGNKLFIIDSENEMKIYEFEMSFD